MKTLLKILNGPWHLLLVFVVLFLIGFVGYSLHPHNGWIIATVALFLAWLIWGNLRTRKLIKK